MDKILSVIVPTYNMEKYLERCLNSLVLESDLMDGLDVLVINDGSKDKSSELAHGFEERYPDIFTVIDKENGNYGSCVNVGLELAKGKYVKILDADDFFETRNLESFLLFLGNSTADLILSPYRENWPGGVNDIEFSNLPRETIFGFDQLSKSDVTKAFIHAITYKTSILRENGYAQFSGISYTDLQWVTEPMAYISTIQYYPYIVYNYVIGREGQTINASIHCKNMWMENKIILHLADYFEKGKDQQSSGQRFYIFNKVRSLAASTYNFYLNDFSDSLSEIDLVDFDIQLSTISPEIYESLDDERIRTKYFTFLYVRNWRKHRSRCTIKFRLYDSYCSLRKRVIG